MTASPAADVVTYDVTGAVAVVTIDNPPINASSARVRAGVIDALKRATADDAVTGIVLRGTDRHFVTGSDLREFDGAMPEPTLPDVIAVIESSPKPVAAALTGQVLGGGFELALACDTRIMHKNSVIGLPEVSLGMTPGAGGTQRLPRLLGRTLALEVICNGLRHGAAQALALGIADDVVSHDLTGAAIRLVAGRPKRPLLNEPVAIDPHGHFEAVACAAIAHGRGRPQVVSAVGSVLMAGSVPANVALAHERSEFDRLRLGREARALRHLFFAERAAAKVFRSTVPPAITTVGIVGAGTMGQGIARAFAEAGLDVVLLDQTPSAVSSAHQALADDWKRAADRGRLPEDRAHALLKHITPTARWADLAPCQLVVEAVYEDHSVKADVLRQLESVVDNATIIATNTSYLDLDVLAEGMTHPERFGGLHFFAPAFASKAVEVVRWRAADDRTVSTLVRTVRALGKIPILARNAFGFIGNRVFAAYRGECERMVLQGSTPRAVDTALTAFGFAMGPFAVADLSGLDVAWRMRQSSAGRVHVGPSPLADRLCEAGRFGRKAGAGWYRYEPGSARPIDDPLITELAREVSQQEGVAQSPPSSAEIVHRALSAMTTASARVVRNEIAMSEEQIDLLMTSAYGFPRHEGGPAFWGRGQDLAWPRTEPATSTASPGGASADVGIPSRNGVLR